MEEVALPYAVRAIVAQMLTREAVLGCWESRVDAGYCLDAPSLIPNEEGFTERA